MTDAQREHAQAGDSKTGGKGKEGKQGRGHGQVGEAR